MLKKNKALIHLALLLIVVAVLIWSLIKPSGYLIWSMEVVPGVVLLILVTAVYKRFRLTTLSYLILSILAILMFIGGHYTYNDVPFFNWLKDEFNLERNHYDRFGHFVKGAAAIVVRELLLRTSTLTREKWLPVLCVSVMLAVGALYEILEWLAAAVTKKGQGAADFLGTQGDIWDTQWDMALVLAGSILAVMLLSKVHDRFMEKENLRE